MKNTLKGELAVCGRAAVHALGQRHPERVRRLYLNNARVGEFGELCAWLAANKRPYNIVADEDLERLSDSVHHQGAVAMIEPPRIEAVDARLVEAWARGGEKIVALDGIGNALNLGAVVRSMAFFGIRTLVISDDDQDAKLTTSAYRVAQGAMELVRVYRSQTAAAFARLAAGKILRVGADHRGEKGAAELGTAASGARSVALFLGNEEEGISATTKAALDLLVSIPGSGELESLNVAQAATVFCWELSGRGSAAKANSAPASDKGASLGDAFALPAPKPAPAPRRSPPPVPGGAPGERARPDRRGAGRPSLSPRRGPSYR